MLPNHQFIPRAPTPETAPPAVRPVVLLVEDAPALTEWVLQVMKTDGDVGFHHCSEAASAVPRALEVEPTVIVQDFSMVGLHGLELMARYRAVSALDNVPVIMLIDAPDVEVTRLAFEAGAADCVVKARYPVELMPRIRAHSMNYALLRERAGLMHTLAEQTRQLEETIAELARIAPGDPVTGLATAQLFESTLEREWKRAARERAPVSLALVELNHFRQYEQFHGRVRADECLREVARVVKSHSRRPADLSARLVGDRLALLLSQTHAEGARMVASQVRAEIAALKLAHSARDDALGIVTASIGVATLVPRPLQPVQLVPRAQQALARANRRGGDVVVHASLDDTSRAKEGG